MKFFPCAIVVSSLMMSACSTSGVHGSFIPHSYIDANANSKGEVIQHVTGVSSQTWWLYIFPTGEPPSTDAAIDDAMSKAPGTRYLTDISIDDSVKWEFGYREQIIEVDADARN